MRLIDADALKTSFAESKEQLWEIYHGLTNRIHKEICSGQIVSFTEAILRIKDAPTVDAVPVVRCKDCIHQRITDGFYVCHKFMDANVSIITNPNNYCSLGRSL